MSSDQSRERASQLLGGHCRVCGMYFVGMTEDEFKRAVSRHILDEHRDEPADKVVVEGGEYA